MTDLITRRTFSLTTAMALSAAVFQPTLFADPDTNLTAAQVIDLIKQHLNMPWDTKTYRDTFKAGDPNTPVKGIASCFMSTLDVIQKAQKQGLNLVISHEPTFWTDADLIEPIKNDPMYKEKLAFIESNGMVVWRIHDHWHRWKPEPMTQGTERLLDWTESVNGQRIYKIPPTTLGKLAEQVAKGLYSPSVRIIGDPNLPVSSVARGAHTLSGNIAAFAAADVAMSSEVREWESVEYARDLIESGAKKGMIVLSHEAGEEEGMVIFAGWMKNVTPGIRTKFISTDDRLYMA